MGEIAVIGIDLGTTYSCMAVYEPSHDKVTIIPNEIGANTTPSYVNIDENDHATVGNAAKSNGHMNPLSTVYDVKRLIGRRMDDPALQRDLELWPFSVIGESNTPKVVLNNQSYHPEELSAKILAHLKNKAEDYLRQPVTQAVITVPAYFNDGQRQATKDAGKIAGLEVLRILNEPTAAAIAYCHQRDYQSLKQNLVIFDLGGGTLDIAVLTVNGANIQIKAVGGDTHLGGEDFDNALADYCIQEFEKEHKINLASGKHSTLVEVRTRTAKLLRRLKIACEQAKINITSARSNVISLDAARGELDLVVKVTRSTFNSLNQPLFDKCIQLMDKTIQDGGFDKAGIDEVILVGGSSRIPHLQDMISSYFDSKALCKRINGDEAVAYGAAIQAALMTYREEILSKEDKRLNITIQDVIPLPIGIEALRKGTKEPFLDVIIRKNTPVPCSSQKRFKTRFTGHQPTIGIYQGEEPLPTQNEFLGMFQTRNLPANCKRGEPIDVTMAVSEEGILQVTASYQASADTDGITVEEFKGRLSTEEVTQLQIKEAALQESSRHSYI